jgi:hypothetical protein
VLFFSCCGSVAALPALANCNIHVAKKKHFATAPAHIKRNLHYAQLLLSCGDKKKEKTWTKGEALVWLPRRAVSSEISWRIHFLVKETLHRHRAGFERQGASPFMKRVKVFHILGEAAQA